MEINQYDLRLTKEKVPVLTATGTFSLPSDYRLNNSLGAVSLMEDFFSLSDRAEEYIYLIALNSIMIPIGIFEISHGSVNRSILSPREVFIRLLLCGAAGMILLHNHPCGSRHPSMDDRNVFQRFYDAANLMQMELLDFIIMGSGFFSFRDENLFPDAGI